MKEQLFEMGEEDFYQFLENSKGSFLLTIFSWIELGKKMGFDPFTVRLVPDQDPKFFFARPTEGPKEKEEKEVYDEK